MILDKLIKTLHEGNYSCVIANGNEVRTFTQRGIADLYALLNNDPGFLEGASVADKVVGKGAAALMVLGRVKELYTDIISSYAIKLLEGNGVSTYYGSETPFIRNRDNTGWCPVEKLCVSTDSPSDIFRLIENFINSKK